MATALPTSLGEAPRRIGLSLPELQRAAEAVGAPLPFDLADAARGSAMEDRLGTTPATARDSTYRAALAGLGDPTASLAQRGLLADGVLEEGMAGALGLLAAPSVVLDVEARVGEVQARGWHRQRGDAVAMLSTIDGVVFELAWCHVDGWAVELARLIAPSAEWESDESAVPTTVDLPWELVEAATEAIATGRSDLVPVLAARHTGETQGADDVVLPDATVTHVLTSLNAEAQGRLRATIGRVGDGEPELVGVRSWTLLADGWRALRVHGDGRRLSVTATGPEDLSADLGPLLAEAAR